MLRTGFRASIILGIVLAASAAWGNNWKGLVATANGTWTSSPDSRQWRTAPKAGAAPIIAPDSAAVLRKLPKGVQEMLRAETVDNPWIKGHEEMKRKLGPFRPEARQVFDLPYIPIPADKMKFDYESSGMNQHMRDNVTYSRNGKKMIRYFIHPLYADRYKALIETYGIKYGEYQATCTSSPRSLIAWKKDSPKKPLWVKVSVHSHLDYYYKTDRNGNKRKVGISRVQTEKKARRSALVNAAFNSANRTELARHKVDFMAEPASFVPGEITYKGKKKRFDRATIFRQLPEGLTNDSGNTHYVPAFTFIKNMKPTLARINATRTSQGKKPINAIGWMTKGLIEPLVRTYIHLGVEHGLQGELHTQNFLLEVDKKGVPTGKVMVKDLDGFRMDLDMRIRNGRSIKYLKHFKNPFDWAKHSATQGSSSNPAVLQGWFNKLIRNVNGFTTTRTVNGKKETVYSTPAGQLMVQLKKDFPDVYQQLKRQAVRRDPSLQGNNNKIERKAVEQVFDLVARAQFSRQTGIRVPMSKWGYGQDKGLNNGLNILRTQLMNGQDAVGAKFNRRGELQVDSRVQGVLKNHFKNAKGRKDDRTWTNGRSPRTYRLVRHGVIEALSPTGLHAGYAVLKPSDADGLSNQLRQQGYTIPKGRLTSHHLTRYSAKDRSSRTPFGRWLNGSRSVRTNGTSTRNRTRGLRGLSSMRKRSGAQRFSHSRRLRRAIRRHYSNRR